MSDDLLWACDCTGEGCSNPKHHDFWMPENWPGGRAPVRWTYHDRSAEREAGNKYAGDSMGVDVWVPECCEGPDPLCGQLWWASQGAPKTASDRVKVWLKLEAEMLAERDPILDLRDSQEEAHWLPGAMPG